MNNNIYYFNIPTKCPCCGSDTFIRDDFLYCSNPECEGKMINKLIHFCSKKGLDIKGLSESTLQKLMNWEWVSSVSDIYKLFDYRNEWYKKDGFGVKSVDNILEAIENSKECEMWQFISAFGIPLIGTSYAKIISQKISSIGEFIAYIDIDYDFTKWDNFGPEINASLHNFDYSEMIYMLDNYFKDTIKNSLWKNPEEKKKESAAAGKTFAITGKLVNYHNRDEAVAAIEAAGGKVVNSVSKKTDYLVNNDFSSKSSKNMRAQELGIPIITEEQLRKLL